MIASLWIVSPPFDAAERLLRRLVRQAPNGFRSERLLCEQLGYNMLYCWFVGLSTKDAASDHSTRTKNRDRLIKNEVACALLAQVVQRAGQAHRLSDEHFSFGGTLAVMFFPQR